MWDHRPLLQSKGPEPRVSHSKREKGSDFLSKVLSREESARALLPDALILYVSPLVGNEKDKKAAHQKGMTAISGTESAVKGFTR